MVVNIHKDEYDIYIGRAGKGKDGYWGNPVQFNRHCPVCSDIHYHDEREDLLVCYENYLIDRIRKDKTFRNKLTKLYGKVLGCFCKPSSCHGDVMLKHIKLLHKGKWDEKYNTENS